MKRTIIAAVASGAVIGGIVAGAVMRLPEAKPVPVARGAAARVDNYPAPGPVGPPNSMTWLPHNMQMQPTFLLPDGSAPTAARGRVPPWSIDSVPGQ